MNCLRKRREAKEINAESLKEKAELEELRILLEGRYVNEDYLS